MLAASAAAGYGRLPIFSSSSSSTGSKPPDRQNSENEDPLAASVRSAFQKAASYKKRSIDALQSDDLMSSSTSNSPSLTDASQNPSQAAIAQNVSAALPGIWKDPARQNKQEADMLSALTVEGQNAQETRSQQASSEVFDVEIITRDGIIRRKAQKPSETFARTKEPKRSGLNSSDFIGLDFADKKSSRKPIGLAAGLEAPPPGSLPEIEIITRDGNSLDEVNKGGLYKPKVATWGIFERPANISRAYGGGRTIKPGEQLETEDEKNIRESRTRQLLDAYRKKIGLDVEPEIKANCLKALEDGNDLMKKGEMRSALIFFEKVMEQMPFQSELHGTAALQWALCLDSMNRFQEARSMYEKIVSHPNVSVRKKAKQLLFGFQAMDALKLSASAKWDSSAYRKYFDAFADGYNTLYKENMDDKAEGQFFGETLMYLGFLMFPFLLVFLLVILRSS